MKSRESVTSSKWSIASYIMLAENTTGNSVVLTSIFVA